VGQEILPTGSDYNDDMLRELAVQNLALIEDVHVELQPGFCAWTGETGAGKTLLLSALGLLLGERGSAELLRTGADELRVAGVFELANPRLREPVERLLGASLDDGQVILTRRLTRAGRSLAYVNEQPVSLATLRQLGSLLVDVHGQRESQSLLQPAYQLELLDAFGGLDEMGKSFATLAEKVRSLRRRQAGLLADRHQRQRELALLRFEREELDRAALVPGELAELGRQRERLHSAQALQTFAGTACGQLYDEEDSIFDQLGRLAREGQKWAGLDPSLADLVTRLEGVAAEAQDVAETLRVLAQRWQADPARLDEVEDRLQLLRRLEVKYSRPVEELPAYRLSLDEQEARLQRQEDDLGNIESELHQAFAALRQAAAELSRQRQRVARRLAAEAQKQLADVGMKGARLEVAVEQMALGDDPLAGEVPSTGLDHLELLLAANPGEPALPLRKVASGGELSRTMLALKTVLAEQDQVATLVFDEIDANVGGRLGDVLGEKLAVLGRTHQVICVTHLPQVASYARHQWTIRKARRGKRTTTTIALLAEPERLDELADMLRGEARGETTRQEVEAMLATARRRW
jgi:DNA repair protein RecN (Recombination protein N)